MKCLSGPMLMCAPNVLLYMSTGIENLKVYCGKAGRRHVHCLIGPRDCGGAVCFQISGYWSTRDCASTARYQIRKFGPCINFRKRKRNSFSFDSWSLLPWSTLCSELPSGQLLQALNHSIWGIFSDLLAGRHFNSQVLRSQNWQHSCPCWFGGRTQALPDWWSNAVFRGHVSWKFVFVSFGRLYVGARDWWGFHRFHNMEDTKLSWASFVLESLWEVFGESVNVEVRIWILIWILCFCMLALKVASSRHAREALSISNILLRRWRLKRFFVLSFEVWSSVKLASRP